MAVEFFENDNLSNQYMSKQMAKKDRVVGWLVKTKIVSNEKQARALLLITSIIFLLITIVVYGYYVFGIGNKAEVKFIFPQELKNQINNAQTA